jgi:hypothetical protein
MFGCTEHAINMHFYVNQKPARQFLEANGYGNAVSEFREFSPIVVEQNIEHKTQQTSLPTSRRSSPKEEVVEQTFIVSSSMIQVASFSLNV